MGSHIALFAGVGMTDIATERAGFKTTATAEIDPWNREILKRRYPDAHHYSDVRHVTADKCQYIKRPLLVSGGFPCQDVSPIGAGLGVANGARSGLWSEFKRVIQEFKPEYVLIENSPMLKTRGLHLVLADLHEAGYDARWDCIPAAAVGAPHLRDRIFIVAWRRDCHGPFYFGGDEIGTVTGGVLTERGSNPSIPLVRMWLPRAGELCHGKVIAAEPLAPLRDARKVPARLYPTPRAAANEWRTTRNAPSHGKGHGKTLAGEVNDLERAAGRTPARPSDSAGNLNPVWVEWLMGLPLGWTDLSIPSNDLTPHPGWDAEPVGVPRTLSDVPDRRARLGALGNGLVWPCAAFALNMIPNGR